MKAWRVLLFVILSFMLAFASVPSAEEKQIAQDAIKKEVMPARVDGELSEVIVRKWTGTVESPFGGISRDQRILTITKANDDGTLEGNFLGGYTGGKPAPLIHGSRAYRDKHGKLRVEIQTPYGNLDLTYDGGQLVGESRPNFGRFIGQGFKITLN